MRSIIPIVDSSSLKLLIAFLMPLLLLTTCKKDCPDTPAEPCPCTGDACIDEMMAYTYFLPGTWWVYEEQNSGLRDSVYVYEAFEGENANGFRYFTVRMHSEYDGYNYYHEFSETSTSISITRPDCFVQHLYRTKTKPGDFRGTDPIFFNPIILNDYRNVGGGQLSIDSVHSSPLECVFFDIDECASEEFEHVGFNICYNLGIEKKYQFEQDKIWKLRSFNIIQ